MPVFRIYTNVSKDKIPKDFLKDLLHLVADTLKKPLHGTSAHVIPDQLMAFGEPDADTPCAEISLVSIGYEKLSREESQKFTDIVFDKVTTDLGISPNKIHIHYSDAKPQHIAFDRELQDKYHKP